MTLFNKAEQKFTQAAVILAASPKGLKQRLFEAYSAGGLAFLTSEHLPADLWSAWERIDARLNSAPPSHGGSLQPTLHEMSEEEAVEIAKLFMKLAHEIWQESARRQYQGR